jgi:hypothetical protein
MAPILHRNGSGSFNMIWLQFRNTARVETKNISEKRKGAKWTQFSRDCAKIRVVGFLVIES